MDRKRIVVIGAGFGGLNFVKTLKNAPLDITIIDKTNHHLFQPLLYQVAAAALSPGDIAIPIRSIFKKQENVQVILEEVVKIEKQHRRVTLSNQKTIEYDYLVIAIGALNSYFGHHQWECYAPGLKTLRDALDIREKLLVTFEKAEMIEDPKKLEEYQTIIVVGGGATGIEVAGSIAEIVKKTMLGDFRKLDTSKTRIILVQRDSRLLIDYDPSLSKKAEEALNELGVEVWSNSSVTEINCQGVQINDKFVRTKNVVWAAGNYIHPLLKTLNEECDNMGRVKVKGDLSLKSSPNIFVIGDAAHFISEKTLKPLPAIAPVAIQQGQFLGKYFLDKLAGKESPEFKYIDRGKVATIGRKKAVAEVRNMKFSGFPAWLIWVFIHIYFLIGFRNKTVVMFEWLWMYITYQGVARLITNKPQNKDKTISDLL